MVRQRRPQEALTYYEAANDIEETAQAHFMIGAVHLGARRAQQALEHLERAVEMEPNAPHMLWQVSQAYILTNRPEEALGALRRLLKVAPDHAEGRRMEAWLVETLEGSS